MNAEEKPKQLNLFVFIALMGTSTVALSSKLFFRNIVTDVFAYVLEISILLIFSYYFIVFLKNALSSKSFLHELKNPKTANLYSSIPNF